MYKENLCLVSASRKEGAEGLEDNGTLNFIYEVRGQSGLPETLKKKQNQSKKPSTVD